MTRQDISYTGTIVPKCLFIGMILHWRASPGNIPSSEIITIISTCKTANYNDHVCNLISELSGFLPSE